MQCERWATQVVAAVHLSEKGINFPESWVTTVMRLRWPHSEPCRLARVWLKRCVLDHFHFCPMSRHRASPVSVFMEMSTATLKQNHSWVYLKEKVAPLRKTVPKAFIVAQPRRAYYEGSAQWRRHGLNLFKHLRDHRMSYKEHMKQKVFSFLKRNSLKMAPFKQKSAQAPSYVRMYDSNYTYI